MESIWAYLTLDYKEEEEKDEILQLIDIQFSTLQYHYDMLYKAVTNKE